MPTIDIMEKFSKKNETAKKRGRPLEYYGYSVRGLGEMFTGMRQDNSLRTLKNLVIATIFFKSLGTLSKKMQRDLLGVTFEETKHNPPKRSQTCFVELQRLIDSGEPLKEVVASVVQARKNGLSWSEIKDNTRQVRLGVSECDPEELGKHILLAIVDYGQRHELNAKQVHAALEYAAGSVPALWPKK